MWSLFIPASATALESVSTRLWEMGTAGIVEESEGVRAFFEDAVERARVCAPFGLGVTEARQEEPFDAREAAPLACDPILVGERFFVAPSWAHENAPAGRFRLTIDATSAFGSGRHESTQMCIEALEKYLQPGQVVLDVGCGSGILAAAAQLLGAGTVFSCDIHEESVQTAKALVQTPLFVGSADGVRSHAADIVVANISAKILDVIARDLQRATRPGGLVVLGGFIEENPPKCFYPREIFTKGEWQCWLCGPQDISPSDVSGESVTHSRQWW
jgi:ribosomal protein L11 methyltransferase